MKITNTPAAPVVLPDGLTGVLLLGSVSRLATVLAMQAQDEVLRAELACDDGDEGSARLRERYEELNRAGMTAIRLLSRIVGTEVTKAAG